MVEVLIMNKDILLVAESVSNEKGVDKGVIFEAVEKALASVTAGRYPEEVNIRVSIDRNTGDYQTFRYWTIVPDEIGVIEYPGKEMLLAEAKKIDAALTVGDVVEEQVESVAFGRIAAQHAKQIILQEVRKAELFKMVEQYRQRIGDLIIGVVEKPIHDGIFLNLGDNAKAFLPRTEMIPREVFRQGDRVRAYLYKIDDDKKGPQLLVSRTRPEMLVNLFKIEVPEIGEQIIEIKAAARDPGIRAKIAVKTNDGRIDPIGACVGMRGSRVQAVSSELGGERIDIVLWDDNPAQLVINAMAPAEISSIVVDEEKKVMDIAVSEEQLSQAIGRSGQNVRLASELTGWTLNIMSEAEAAEKTQTETEKTQKIFMEQLNVEEDMASLLQQAGFATIEEVAYISLDELLAIEDIDQDIAEELQRRARDVLLVKELATRQGNEPAQDLLEMEGMTSELAKKLAEHDILTREDLAEQSVDELTEVSEIDAEQAAKLIMTARAPWFVEKE
jgi:N utilization substance protein A